MDRPLRMVQGMGFLREGSPLSGPRPMDPGHRASVGSSLTPRPRLQSSIDKASRKLEESRGMAQRLIDRYDALAGLVGHAAATQALDEAKDAFLRAETALRDLKELEA